MQKTMHALERLDTALEKLENRARDHQARGEASQAERARLAETAAHLRGRVSTLKKANEKLETRNRRGARQVEKAMGQIDGVLNG